LLIFAVFCGRSNPLWVAAAAHRQLATRSTMLRVDRMKNHANTKNSGTLNE